MYSTINIQTTTYRQLTTMKEGGVKKPLLSMYSVGSASDYWTPRVQSPTYQDSHENWEFDLYSDLRRPQQLVLMSFEDHPLRWLGGLRWDREDWGEEEEKRKKGGRNPSIVSRTFPKWMGPLLLPFLFFRVICSWQPWKSILHGHF